MNPILDAPIVSDQRLQYAGFWIRTLALIIDFIIISFIVGVGFFVFGAAILLTGSVTLFFLAFFTLWLSGAGYFVFMESSSKQATVGKMAVGIKVGDLHGQRISFGNALGRYLSKFLSSLILYIGWIMVAFSDKKQALHDKLADTVVYYG